MRALGFLVLVWWAIPAWGQTDPAADPERDLAQAPAHDPAGPARLTALRLTDGVGVRVDGRLDEDAWGAAEPATGFRQLEPTPGAASTERTEARVLYDRSALYVGVTAYVRDPATLVRRLVRRDADETADRVFVEIGSLADGRTAFSFGVNLAGVQRDVLLFNDQNEGDTSWDGVWDSAVARFEGEAGHGYSVELKIPLSQLRYDALARGPWQIQFRRDIPSTGETSYWAPLLPDQDGYVSRFGALHGLADLRAPRRVEWVPYAATRLTRAPGNAANPFYAENDLDGTLGFDAQVGLTSSLTLTATANPDFGQVEQDPADVNLTDFETQFAERRPFFVEGTDVFDFGGTRAAAYVTDRPQFFYTRRIGRTPLAVCRVYPEDPACARGTEGAYTDSPQQTTILGAAKLSGTVGGWTVGLLNAVTSPEHGQTLLQTGCGPRGCTGASQSQRLVEPLSNYAVARARRAWNGGRTGVGLFGSSVLRDANRDFLRDLIPTDATIGGLDLEHTFPGRVWSVSGVAAGSVVTGGSESILRLQQSSRRYYQRPDAGYLTFDPARTAIGGYRAEATLAKVGGGSHWRGAVTASATSPGFETNDLGFQRRADWVGADWRINYNTSQLGAAGLQRLEAYAFGGQAVNYGGDLVFNRFNAGFTARYTNLWSSTVVLSARPVYVNDRLTRGGPLALRPADYSASVRVRTNPGLPLAAGLRVARRGEFAHAHAGVGREWTWQVQPSVGARITDALQVSLAPTWTSAFNTDQYLFAAPDAASPASLGGRRYVFSDVRQEAVELETRVDWAFTPDLTLQLYAVPYVDSRRYEGFRQLAEARTYDFVRFGATPGTTITPLRVAGGTETEVGVDEANRFRVTDLDGETFDISDRNFTYLSLRGNAVVRWQWRPGSELFFVWQQTVDGYDAFRGLDVASDLGDVFLDDVQNVFQIKATYWFGL